jgi:hypothetical protein
MLDVPNPTPSASIAVFAFCFGSNQLRHPSVTSSHNHRVIARMIGPAVLGENVNPFTNSRRQSFARPHAPRRRRARPMLASRRF